MNVEDRIYGFKKKMYLIRLDLEKLYTMAVPHIYHKVVFMFRLGFFERQKW